MDDPGLIPLLKKSLIDGVIPSSLKLTVKTHKDPIKFPQLHCSPKYCFAGLSSWVAQQLRSATCAYSGIIESVEELVKQVQRQRPVKTSYFVRLDVADFFLSGSFDDLIHDATVHMEPTVEKSVLEDIPSFLLRQQFVTSSSAPSRLWRSILGSGMGLIHSGELASASLYNHAKKTLTSLSALRAHGILGYWRYRDDCFIHATDRLPFRNRFAELRRKAGYFKLTCEEVGSVSLRFLNVVVYIQSGRIHTKLFFKERSSCLPLSPMSGHTPFVHESWRIAVLRSLARLSSTQEGFLEAKNEFIQRFRKFYSPVVLLRALENVQYTMPERRVRVEPNCIWLPVPYHPAYAKEASANIRAMSRAPEYNALYRSVFGVTQNVKLAWKNHFKPLHNRLQINC